MWRQGPLVDSIHAPAVDEMLLQDVNVIIGSRVAGGNTVDNDIASAAVSAIAADAAATCTIAST